MAVTIEEAPQAINPAYNENYFLIDSTESAEIGFRYVVRVYNGSDLLGRYKVRPRPSDGKGEIDIKSLLQQQLGEDYDPTLTDTQLLTNQSLTYNLEIDEEYLVSEPFDDYIFAGSSFWPNFSDPSINPNAIARTALEHSTEPVFEQGDVINVVQDDTVNFRPELEGIHTVLDKFEDTGTWYVVLDLPWIGSGPASTGDSLYADNQKSVFTGITSGDYKVFKAAFPHATYKDYDDADWITLNSASNIITTLPDGVRISRDTNTYLSCYNASGTTLYVVFNINGSFYRYSIGSDVDFIQFNILPSDDNITEEFVGGSWMAFGGGLDLSDVDSYTVQLADNVDFEYSQIKPITLYSECDAFDTFDLTFIDRLGSWITIPFNKGSYLDQRVEKQKFRKKYGSFSGSGWTYSLQDRGVKTYDSEEELTYTVNSGILSEVESQYLKELVSSPSVFVTINGGETEAIDIVTSQLPLHKKRTKRDRKATIKFVKSVQDNING